MVFIEAVSANFYNFYANVHVALSTAVACLLAAASVSAPCCTLKVILYWQVKWILFAKMVRW